VVALLEGVGARSANVAEMVFTALSEIFKHGLARHVVTANPCTGISVSAICGKPEPRRQRLKLTEAELRAMLPALPSIGTENTLAVKLLLVTCTRIGELTRAEWKDVSLSGRNGSLTKTARPARASPSRFRLCGGMDAEPSCSGLRLPLRAPGPQQAPSTAAPIATSNSAA
jgi:hypothetical protein